MTYFVGHESEEYVESVGDEDYEEGEIEELPSSINRPASRREPAVAPANNGYGGEFEDDGLPMEFTPPTK